MVCRVSWLQTKRQETRSKHLTNSLVSRGLSPVHDFCGSRGARPTFASAVFLLIITGNISKGVELRDAKYSS